VVTGDFHTLYPDNDVPRRVNDRRILGRRIKDRRALLRRQACFSGAPDTIRTYEVWGVPTLGTRWFALQNYACAAAIVSWAN
jgi:hypothetical protein